MRIFVAGGVSRSLIGFRGPLLKRMVELNNEVIACAGDWDDDIVKQLSDIGVVYRSIALERNGINPYYDLKTIIAYKKVLAQIKPDYALLYTIKPVVYGSFAAASRGIPNIYSMITGLGYTFGADSFSQRLIGALAKSLYRQALKYNKKVFFQNPDDQHCFIKNKLVERTRTVLINGSGVDVHYYKMSLPVTDRIVFLLIARLIRDKGICEYIEAARYIKKKYPDVKFQVMGGIDTNPTAIERKTIEEWCSEGIIEYIGKTDDVRPYIANASVYVLPSYREGTPRTVLEAMSMGRPIITTDAPGCRETVIDGCNGFLVPVKSVEMLAKAMERFIQEPNLIPRMGEESRKIAEMKYDVEKVNQVILRAMELT